MTREDTAAGLTEEIRQLDERRGELRVKLSELTHMLSEVRDQHGRAVAEGNKTAAIQADLRSLQDEQDGVSRALEILAADRLELAGKLESAQLAEAKTEEARALKVAADLATLLRDRLINLTTTQILPAEGALRAAIQDARQAVNRVDKLTKSSRPYSVIENAVGRSHAPSLAIVNILRAFAEDRPLPIGG